MSFCAKISASCWVSVLGIISPKNIKVDITDNAIEKLEISIKKMQQKENELLSDLEKVRLNAKARRQANDRNSLKTQLVKAKRIQRNLRSCQNQVSVMENHLEVLSHGDFNKQMLETLQTSATAMKEMGVAQDVVNVDKVIAELEDGIQSANDISTTIGLHSNTMDMNIEDDELEHEFSQLMAGGDVLPNKQLQANEPAVTSTMSTDPEPDKGQSECLKPLLHDSDEEQESVPLSVA